MPLMQGDRKRFEACLAKRHHLTMNEAHEELEDFLYLEDLNRELRGDLRE